MSAAGEYHRQGKGYKKKDFIVKMAIHRLKNNSGVDRFMLVDSSGSKMEGF